MKVTKEQLHVAAFAKKRDEKRPELTQIQLEAGGRAVATNGRVIAIVDREPIEAKSKNFDARVPTHIARTVLDQAKYEGIANIELHREEDGPTFYVSNPEVEEKEGTATRYHPVSDKFPDYESVLAGALRGTPRARVALESTILATLCGLRNAVGGAGAIKIDLRGELDPVVARWNDDKGHRVCAVLMPMKLEPWEWAGEDPPKGYDEDAAKRGESMDLPGTEPAAAGAVSPEEPKKKGGRRGKGK